MNNISHSIVSEENKDKLGSESFRAYDIDEVSNNICLEISKRLPRRLDAYKHSPDDFVKDNILIPGLGNIEVTISQGIFNYIFKIQSNDFYLWNCRQTGKDWNKFIRDVANPSEINIKPLDLEIKLYNDDSGIFVKKDGFTFTNSAVRYAGRGYKGDSYRDDLHWMYKDCVGDYDTKLEPIFDKLGFLDKESKDPRERFKSFIFYSQIIKNPHKLTEFLDMAGIPHQLSWNTIKNSAIDWMKNEFLEKILRTPINQDQKITLPEKTPYLEKFGKLYAWADASKIKKFREVNCDCSKLKGFDKNAITQSRGLFLSRYSFIYCGQGIVDESKDRKEYLEIPGMTLCQIGLSEDDKILVQIHPNSSDNIFVIDNKPYEDYTENAFKTNFILSKKQFEESEALRAKTLIPLTEYDGSYKKPVFLIARPVTFDEVTKIFDNFVEQRF
ncbi:MAG: hypothetical protein JW791_04485 [Nanoarchaeota archaeon]|nr:hypothetical protein [Nanoarchaeota archaeon]